jgi:hypothetical protein
LFKSWCSHHSIVEGKRGAEVPRQPSSVSKHHKTFCYAMPVILDEITATQRSAQLITNFRDTEFLKIMPMSINYDYYVWIVQEMLRVYDDYTNIRI